MVRESAEWLGSKDEMGNSMQRAKRSLEASVQRMLRCDCDFCRTCVDVRANLSEDDGRVLPKLQAKVQVKKEDRMSLAHLLVSRGICTWVPLDEVAEYQETEILNGVFGVRKQWATPSGLPHLRLIMNLSTTKLQAQLSDFPTLRNG